MMGAQMIEGARVNGVRSLFNRHGLRVSEVHASSF